MKKTIVKGLHSPDIDLETYSPTEKDDFAFLLQVFVGMEGEQGDECFDMFVCTTKWIERNYSKQTILIGLHTMIVQEYNYERIIRAVKELFCTEGISWDQIRCDLSYYGLSEMDYKHWSSYKNIVRCGIIKNSNP